MKTLTLLLTLLITSMTLGQMTPSDSAYVDSLKIVIENAKDDTTKIIALEQWDNRIYFFDTELDKQLNDSIISIGSKIDLSKVSPREKYIVNMYMARANLNLGEVNRIFGKKEKAKEHYLESSRLFLKIRDYGGVGMCYNNIGIVLNTQGLLDQSLEYHFKSLKVKEFIKDSAGIASSLTNIGIVYSDQGFPEESRKYHQDALKIREQINHTSKIPLSLNNIASSYIDLEKYDSALIFYERSLDILEVYPNEYYLASTYRAIGTVYKRKGEYAKALDYYNHSIEISTMRGDQGQLAIAYKNKGDLFLIQGKIDQSIVELERAYNIATDISDLLETNRTSQILYEVYSEKGNSSKALYYLEVYMSTKDSLDNEDMVKNVVRQKYEYDYTKQYLTDSLNFAKQKEVDDIKHEQELLQGSRERLVLFSGLLVALFFGIYAFRVYRRKKKDHEIIVEQKKEVEHQKELVEEATTEILDSIKYAKRIQEAILPSPGHVKEILPDSFILYQPKDVVSGDFYFVEEAITTDTETKLAIFAAADCTGHGVPGAFMSIVGNSYLLAGLNEPTVNGTGDALNYLNIGVKKALRQDRSFKEKNVRDGMDIALCAWDKSTNIIYFSGAKNPLYLVRKGLISEEFPDARVLEDPKSGYTLLEFKGDSHPIGTYGDDELKPFRTNKIQLRKGDMIYTFSDGFADQFGGDRGKKYKYKNFKLFLMSISSLPADEQKKKLINEFNDWKGKHEQIDDVLIIGVRITSSK